MNSEDTICAIATGRGGAIGIIRVSGRDAITVADRIFSPVAAGGIPLAQRKAYTISYGNVKGHDGETIDDVLISIFRAPHSYTGEDSVEISCHGSSYILQQILQLLIDNGCRAAEPGEFTRRALLCGKMDLSQAEAVADEISANLEAQIGTTEDSAPKAAPKHPLSETTTSKFANLQFGRNYENRTTR